MPLKRHPALISLSHDHRSTLMTAQLMKREAPPYPGMPVELSDKLQYVHMHFVMDMMPHFEREENVLFPFVAGKSKEINDMIDELKNEHIEIQHRLNALPSLADQVSAMDKAGRLIEKHVRKEEREFFQMVQQVLSEEELLQLQHKLS